MNYWEIVDFECEKKGISRKELAYKAGIAISSVSAGIVRGGIPRVDIAIKIANTLNLPLEYFFPDLEIPIQNSVQLLNKYSETISVLENLPENERNLIQRMIKAAEFQR